MPNADTIARFIARVEENAHVEALREFYTEDASMQENMAPPRVGREALIANELRVKARTRSVRSQCIGPALVAGDIVVMRWRFRFESQDGTVGEFEELAYQHWRGERIHREQFFYDPGQFTRRPPDPGSAS